MKIYRRVVDFKYNNNKYSMFIDNMNKYYFLGIKEDGTYKYIDIDTYIQLLDIFSNPKNIMSVKKNGQKLRIVPKILIGGLLTSITLGSNILTAKLVGNIKEKELEAYYQEEKESLENRYKKIIKELTESDDLKETLKETIDSSSTVINTTNEVDSESETEEAIDSIVRHISFDVVDSDKKLYVDTYQISKYSKAVYIYDSEFVGEILGENEISLNDLYSVIDSNDLIPLKFKDFIKKYCKNYVEKQPNAERRILWENLKDLSIKECADKHELSIKTLSWDALACYVRTENAIYVMKDYEYKEGTWDYQVLYHELSHAARSRWCYLGEYKVRIQADGPNYYDLVIGEALNSVFAVSLFDYEEKDIAYQLQSNIIKLLIDNMDNYNLSDYMNHSMAYFCHQLDEFHGDNNYASVLLKLVQTQYDDYHDSRIEIEQSEYYPIYEYLSDFYYKNRINENTTYEEAQGYTLELINKIMFDVPAEYNIDINYFYTYLNEYCEKIGLDFGNQKTH